MVSNLILFSDGKNLSSVTSLETLLLTVRNRTTQSALSTIFGSSTINVLKLSIKCPLTVSEG